MSDSPTFRVNFSRPMPIFPLDSVVLLPQQAIPLHIFESRYRAMVSDSLDGSGQFAMAVLAPETSGERASDEFGRAEVRPSVCVAQIAKHEKLPDGRYNIVIQGICRAKIEQESPPSVDRAYRTAMLAPVMNQDDPGPGLDQLRKWVTHELAEGSLRHLSAAGSVLGYLQDEQVPTVAVMELVGFALTTDHEIRYKLLNEASVSARAALLRGELAGLGRSLDLTEAQRQVELPKGCSWN